LTLAVRIRRQGGKVLGCATQVTHRVAHLGTLCEHCQAQVGLLTVWQLVDQPQSSYQVPKGLTVRIPLGSVFRRTPQILHGTTVVPSLREVHRQLCSNVSCSSLIDACQIFPNALV
jgi:hypothetical protein